MSARSSSRLVTISMAICRWFLACYPRRTRERFGDDLADVCRSVLTGAYARGGGRAVLGALPRLSGDLAVALGTEWLDAWRAARMPPTSFAAGCLAVAAVVWSLILAASFSDARWAATVLDLNLALTMVLAFGLPVAALVVTRIEERVGVQSRGDVVVGRLSTGATFASWAFLAFHLA